MPNLVVSAVAKWNGTALKKGEKQISQFQKTTNNLAKSFAGAFAAQKIIQFGKAAVQAFAADEKAAKSLAITLKNTGNGFATIATEGFIGRMQQTYKVLDDELRPAFQTLLTATGDLTLSQSALESALDISAGTGKDLQSVTAALAKGYSGNTTALSRLGAGIDKATLKTGDMNKIMGILTGKFKGQALAATKTYAGQMDALAVSAANAKEIIGKGLLDSIAALSGSDGINKAATSMETLAQNVADTVSGLALLIAKAKEIGGLDKKSSNKYVEGAKNLVKGAVTSVGPLGFAKVTRNFLSKQGEKERLQKTPFSPTSMYFTAETALRAKESAEIKKGTNLRKENNKLTAAELADKKKQAELEALKKKFDVDRINLQTALANATDEAEKARIRSLLTIMDEDADKAAKRMADLDKANKDKLISENLATASLNKLAEASRLAAIAMQPVTIGGVPIKDFGSKVTDETGLANIALADAVLTESDLALTAAMDAMVKSIEIANQAEKRVEELITGVGSSPNYGLTAGGRVAGPIGGSQPVNITINTPVGSEEVLLETVQRVMQRLNRYGDSSTFAGAL